jgi:ATP-dependent DNA helicase MPH1
MSSDGYFDDDPFDAVDFAQIDAIEAAYAASTPPRATNAVAPTRTTPLSKKKSPIKEASFYDLTLDLDEDEIEKLDAFIADSYANMDKSKPSIGSMRQTTLHGDILTSTSQPSRSGSSRGVQRTVSSPRNIFGSRPKKTKVWDQTAFAKTGQKKKGKGRQFEESEEQEQEQVEFEQFPAPFVPPGELGNQPKPVP